jgi:hypothetical protein
VRRKYQFVWWGWREMDLGFWRAQHSLRYIYRWYLFLGPLEIRRWTPPEEARQMMGGP